MKSVVAVCLISLFGIPSILYISSLLQIEAIDQDSAFTIMKGLSGLGVSGFAAFVSWKLSNVVVLLYKQMNDNLRHYEERERELHKQYREDTKMMTERAQAVIDKYREDFLKNQAYHNAFMLELGEKHHNQMSTITSQFITEIRNFYDTTKK
jgi:hypothetical protein